MASVAHLRAVILSTLNSPGSQDGNQHFFEELMSHKHNLLKLSNVGPRSPQEQRELESGQYNWPHIFMTQLTRLRAHTRRW